MKKPVALLVLLAASVAFADPVNLLSGRACTLTMAQPYTGSGDANMSLLLNGNKTDRCIWAKPNPSTGVIPRGTISLLDGEITINGYRFYTPSSSTLSVDRLPKSWTLYARSQGDAEWQVLDTRTDVSDWVSNSYKDFQFENARSYSEFMLEFTANCGGNLLGISELEFYQYEQPDLLEILHSGYKVGKPVPAYGPLEGFSAGSKTNLNVEAPFSVDPATGERYLLGGFTLTDYAGNEISSGTYADLPYEYTHAGHAKFYWNWESQTAKMLATLEDQTVPANALLNEISAGRSDNSTTADKAFDNNFAQAGRWLSRPPSSTGEPNWIQYRFLDGKRIITGFKMNQAGTDSKQRLPKTFIFQGSNDGVNYDNLLSVSVANPAVSVENIRFPVSNSTAYEYYRFWITANSDSSWLEIGEIELYSHFSANTLRIVGTPASYGNPEPGYGYYTNLVDGTTYTLSAPAAQISVSDDEKTVASAYRLSLNFVQGQVVSGTSCSYTHTAGDVAVLEWIFSGTYRQSFSVSGGGNVSLAETWAAHGQFVTVTATPGGNGAAFAMWSGDLPEGVDATDPVLTYTADRPRSIVANFAVPFYVKPDGDDSADGTSAATAFATITNALARSANGGVINVLPGTYQIPGDTLSVDKSLTIAATDANPENTVIELEADGSGSLLAVSNPNALLCGITFRGATDTGLKVTGGVIANCIVEDCTTPGNAGGMQLDGGTVTNCVFRNNTAAGFAGGVLITAGYDPVVFDDNIITGNTARTAISDACRAGGIVFARNITARRLLIAENIGGGAYITKATIMDSVFENNSASLGGGRGGGAYLNEGARLERCVIRGNRSSSYGGGAFVESGSLVNVLVAGNNGDGGGIFARSSTTLLNCTFIDNDSADVSATDIRIAGSFSCRNTLISGTICGINSDFSVVTNFSNSARNCCFVDMELTTNSLARANITASDPMVDANGRISKGSPLIDAGDNYTWTADDIDIYGNRRVYRFGTKHGIVDIGCFESTFDKKKCTLLFVK